MHLTTFVRQEGSNTVKHTVPGTHTQDIIFSMTGSTAFCNLFDMYHP